MTCISAQIGPIDLRDQRRVRRVWLVLATVVLLSAGDLYATVMHLDSVGMFEANPLARRAIQMASTPGLVAYKIVTAGFAIGMLATLRRHRAGEVGSWIMLAMMSGVTVFWYVYSDYVARELVNVSYLDAKVVMDRLSGMH